MIHLFAGRAISFFLIDTYGTDPVVPVLVAGTLHAIVMQIRNIVAEDDGAAAEISAAEGDNGCASVDAYRTDLIVEFAWKKPEAGAALHAKVIRRVVCLPEKARTVSRLVRGTATGTGIPPAGAGMTVGADAKCSTAAAIDPDSLAVIAPGGAASAWRMAQLLD